MIMTAGTGRGQAEHSTTHNINSIINNIVRVIQKSTAQREISHRGKLGRVVRTRQAIGSQLPLQEFIIGHVLIDRVNHPFAISPGISVFTIFLKNIPFGVGVS